MNAAQHLLLQYGLVRFILIVFFTVIGARFRFNLSYPDWIETGFLANHAFLRPTIPLLETLENRGEDFKIY